VQYHLASHWNQVYASSEWAETGAAASALRTSVTAVLTDCLRSGGHFLDVACGRGELLSGLPAGIVKIGLDISAGALGHARGQPDADSFVLLRADAGRLPLASMRIDAAACLSALWALPDRVGAIAELSRVLRPGGVLVLHLWNATDDCRLITLGATSVATVLPWLRRPNAVTGPLQLTPDTVTPTLRTAGFKSVAWHEHGYSCAIRDVNEYWAEFAGLAPTAYAAYCQAAPSERARIETLLARLLVRSLDLTGADSLSISWRLGVFTCQRQRQDR
jgi:ubiquinone/menaquinone biosynthesis C-methylase UbiE